MRVLPGPRHLDGALVRAFGVAAHAADDPLRESDPDLLVVAEIRVLVEPFDGLSPRCGVQRRVEFEPEPPAEPLVPLRTEVRARLRQREVEVEENGAGVHAGYGVAAGQRYASAWREASDGSFARTSSSLRRSSSAEITVSSSGATATTTPQGSAINERP